MSQDTHEFRVRPVQRFQLTHYVNPNLPGSMSVRGPRTIGEFPNVESAEEVGVLMQAQVPGSTLTTLDGRTPAYPPKALATAMMHRKPQIGEHIWVDDPKLPGSPRLIASTIDAAHEWPGRRILDVNFGPDVFVNGRGTGQVLDDGTGQYKLLPPQSILIDEAILPDLKEIDLMPLKVWSIIDEPREYTLIENTVGEIDARVFYAERSDQAAQYKAQLERHYGREFRVFSRVITDPVKLAQRRNEETIGWTPLQLDPVHTNYPSLYAIGDEVTVKNYPAKVKGITFTESKVFYIVEWMSEQSQPTEKFPSEDVYPADALASLTR